ncbi:MAG TPA: hypothetical protein VE010_04590 [Thermoanaerobaculia bacterium]|nr:hypothetical protein [Thermoanaerobaculia bacterium]
MSEQAAQADVPVFDDPAVRTVLYAVIDDRPECSIADAAVMPTVTHHQMLADEIIRDLDAIAAKIAGLERRHPSTANFVRAHANVPIEFLATAAAAVEQTPELEAVRRFDVNEARDTLQFIDAYRPVVDKMLDLGRSLKFTLSARRARLAGKSLQIYAIAQALARDPAGAAISPHIANLRRDLGRRGRPRRPSPRD